MIVIVLSMASPRVGSSLGFAASRSELQKKITQILSDPSLKDMSIGIQVTSLKTDEKVFEYNN